ncbi:hypothetical protein JVT61DRAFT_3639 [Boletus reticuloceps]|uniref:Uncharacterized protein n=1 Tax=Boletus reticuloceps TaxID=495285 RepID=A0A8I2YNA5_9AGAM|nr:hypothetical protein JVT61DRAFT_3639 [Boletus reticuloceps]
MLIQELAAKPNWNVPLALRFIKEKYESNPAYLGRVCAFCDYLQRDCGAGYRAVLEAAAHHPRANQSDPSMPSFFLSDSNTSYLPCNACTVHNEHGPHYY